MSSYLTRLKLYLKETYKMYIVTGGAGFIGSNIIRGLNDRGISDILVVDNLTNSDKFRNVVGLHFTDYMDKGSFLEALKSGGFSNVQGIIHQGACSDTTERNGRYMMENNYSYTCSVAEWALRNSVPFVYASSASVYGNAKNGFCEDFANEAPINIYAYSKYLFDQWARKRFDSVKSTFVGLRYFNVYGPHESHKAKMASMVFHGFNQLNRSGVIKLFSGCDGIEDGAQSRDFVYVKDVVSVVLHFALDCKATQGVFNVGTGTARSFKDLAMAVINSVGNGGGIEYIPFPSELRGQYQNFTQANLSALRKAGYCGAFANLEAGVADYVAHLRQDY